MPNTLQTNVLAFRSSFYSYTFRSKTFIMQRFVGNNANNDCDGWRDKLVGKTILKDTDQTSLSSDQVIRESELPKVRRVLPPNAMMTMDYRPERLNIHVDANKKIRSVNYG